MIFKKKKHWSEFNWDVDMLKPVIEKLNKDPNLKVRLKWPDGKTIEFMTEQPKQKTMQDFNSRNLEEF